MNIPASSAAARLHLGAESHPQLINRLDRETSGLVLLAKNEMAARELRKIWEARAVVKTYWAIVHGAVAPPQGSIQAPLGKDAASIIAIKDCVRPDGAAAQTDYRVEKNFLAGRQNVFLSPRESSHRAQTSNSHSPSPIWAIRLSGINYMAAMKILYLALVQDRLTAEQRERLIFQYHALHAGEVAIFLAR